VAEQAPIRVLIGEDQPIVREGIVRVLENSGFEVAGTAADARDLVGKARVYRPDVVVTDIQMPPGHADDGLRAALEIRAADPGVGVLVLSQFLEDVHDPFPDERLVLTDYDTDLPRRTHATTLRSRAWPAS